jgi:hypothetical protein
MPKGKADTPDGFLTAEYDYIAHTVFQANEDRARVASFYFVSVGSIIAAILGTQFAADNLKSVSWGFSILFLILTLLGGLTLAQLARLRAAWHESIEAMNQIKEYYVRHYPDIKAAFKWRGNTIPPTDKPYSIANLIAVEVTLLGALASAASAYFLLFALGGIMEWGWAIILLSFVLSALLQWLWYKRLLVDDR